MDSEKLKEASIQNDFVKRVLKSQLRRLFVFHQQSPSVLQTSSVMKSNAGEAQNHKDGESGGMAWSSDRAQFAWRNWCSVSWRKLTRHSHCIGGKMQSVMVNGIQ